MSKKYSLIKEQNSYSITNVTEISKKGYHFKPLNKSNYDTINVNEITVINPSFIERLLKKKVKRKLDYYKNFILISDEEEDGGSQIEHALNDITRYKEILLYRYRKFLNERYFSLLYQKAELIERELKAKLIKKYEKEKEKEDKKTPKTDFKRYFEPINSQSKTR